MDYWEGKDSPFWSYPVHRRLVQQKEAQVVEVLLGKTCRLKIEIVWTLFIRLIFRIIYNFAMDRSNYPFFRYHGQGNETSGSAVQFRLASRRTLLVYIPPSITVITMKLRDYDENFTDDRPLSPFRDMLRLPIRFEWHAFGKMCQRWSVVRSLPRRKEDYCSINCGCFSIFLLRLF